MCHLEVDASLRNGKTDTAFISLSEKMDTKLNFRECFKIKQEDGVGDLTRPVSLRLLMSRREAGCIIGKSGETISQFRKQSGAKIKISDKRRNERVVSIAGSITEVVAACQLFCQEFEWNMEIHQIIDISYFEHLSKLSKFVFRILLPTSLCGPLIGKAGATLQKIRRVSGCILKMTKNKLPNSTDRVLYVFGTSNAVLTCLELICAISCDIQVKYPEIPYAPAQEKLIDETQNSLLNNFLTSSPPFLSQWNYPQQLGKSLEKVEPRYHKMLNVCPNPTSILRSGVTDGVKDIVERLEMKDVYPTLPLLDCSTYLATIPPQAFPPIPFSPMFYSTLGVLTLSELIRGLPPANTPQVTPNAVHNPLQPAFLNQTQAQQFALNPTNGDVQQEMVIENELIGCVIGRGGTKINNVRRISKANVKISNSKEYSSSRLIIITGSKDAVDTAVNMINTSLLGRENYMQQTLPPK